MTRKGKRNKRTIAFERIKEEVLTEGMKHSSILKRQRVDSPTEYLRTIIKLLKL